MNTEEFYCLFEPAYNGSVMTLNTITFVGISKEYRLTTDVIEYYMETGHIESWDMDDVFRMKIVLSEKGEAVIDMYRL